MGHDVEAATPALDDSYASPSPTGLMLLIAQLNQAANVRDCFGRDMLRDAVRAIKALVESNRALHRRAQAAESPMASRLAWAELKLTWANRGDLQNAARLTSAHAEIRRIHDHLRRAYDDGCDDYGYHSVMDSRADGGPSEPGAVWANRFRGRRGGVVSLRPSEIVGPLIDELLALRGDGGEAVQSQAQPAPQP